MWSVHLSNIECGESKVDPDVCGLFYPDPGNASLWFGPVLGLTCAGGPLVDERLLLYGSWPNGI